MRYAAEVSVTRFVCACDSGAHVSLDGAELRVLRRLQLSHIVNLTHGNQAGPRMLLNSNTKYDQHTAVTTVSSSRIVLAISPNISFYSIT